MCGVFGAYSPRGDSVLEDVYLGLLALQHRGQESAGIAWIDREGNVQALKGMGLVPSAVDQAALARTESNRAIGHVRYSTFGGSLLRNAQPIAANYARGPVAVAHDGTLTNADALMRYLEGRGAIFQSDCDTETILHLMAHNAHMASLEALVDALRRLRGAFSLTVLVGDRLVAARDPWGFRPLVLGRRGETLYAASESCALDIVGAELLRDVEPGEIVVIDGKGLSSLRIPVPSPRKYHCSFEYVYFARPDSLIDGRSVYQVRKDLGRRLARACPCEGADRATGMPDSGTLAALGYAEESRIPHELGVVRNRYVGRTFIQPTQRVRELGVKIKLNPIAAVFADQRAVVVDDSIVRGTTAGRVVALLRERGAREVHLRIASPPVRFPCYYGIDTPSYEELAAARFDVEGIRTEVGADSLGYLPPEELIGAIGLGEDRLCTACFTGRYLEEGTDHDLEL